ncbi:hypothetical protein Bpfe_025151 [Biomphalaria pfeifferi]|uniref:Uncharacterized protein n=1 Tax=Biomphalaria pfeifferi TaxID=112525 RepID=A0AAD8EZ69_BIOPF|nr:hypothetical protein Bpfe_025151 [Biomphalaria pfeifferi]
MPDAMNQRNKGASLTMFTACLMLASARHHVRQEKLHSKLGQVKYLDRYHRKNISPQQEAHEKRRDLSVKTCKCS